MMILVMYFYLEINIETLRYIPDGGLASDLRDSLMVLSGHQVLLIILLTVMVVVKVVMVKQLYHSVVRSDADRSYFCYSFNVFLMVSVMFLVMFLVMIFVKRLLLLVKVLVLMFYCHQR